jgi:hypothetical protein
MATRVGNGWGNCATRVALPSTPRPKWAGAQIARVRAYLAVRSATSMKTRSDLIAPLERRQLIQDRSDLIVAENTDTNR